MTSKPAKARLPMLAAALLCFAAGSLYAWSSMIPALLVRYDVGVQQAGQVFSFAIVAFSLAVLLFPYLPAPMKSSRAAAAAGVLAAISLVLATVAPGFDLFLLFYSLGFGAMSGIIYIQTVELAAKSSAPAVLTPLMVAAFGLGGVVFGPTIRALVALNWQLAALLPVALALIVAAALVFAFPAHEQAASTATNRDTAPIIAPPRAGHVALLWTIFAFGSGTGLMVLGLASAIIEDRGAATALSATVLAVIALGNTGGRLSVSLLGQWLPPIIIAGLSPILAAIGLLTLIISPNVYAGGIGLTLVALSYGLMASAMPVLTRALTSTLTFGHTFALVFTAWGVAGLLSPWLAGTSFDATGSFTAALYFALASSLIALVTIAAFARFPRAVRAG
ncbi:hypothetical protein PSQ90_02035 [Devosia rhodophyticola]|uniref:MFS transporter n=1 Tax=Devosia rhodophyticola TaxID=3026423 RepID=A0ABY7YY60_9HYPH|nr:hypothetical protein [Devosia rhodophyticola]WDR06266.1 hypothetical protein PSQ90_02035 [Devosia rhodophyticola]